MKTFRNLMLLVAAVSLFSSCLVQERGRGHRGGGYGHGGGGYYHRGY